MLIGMEQRSLRQEKFAEVEDRDDGMLRLGSATSRIAVHSGKAAGPLRAASARAHRLINGRANKWLR
jgi:hypothetical protein